MPPSSMSERVLRNLGLAAVSAYRISSAHERDFDPYHNRNELVNVLFEGLILEQDFTTDKDRRRRAPSGRPEPKKMKDTTAGGRPDIRKQASK